MLAGWLRVVKASSSRSPLGELFCEAALTAEGGDVVKEGGCSRLGRTVTPKLTVLAAVFGNAACRGFADYADEDGRVLVLHGFSPLPVSRDKLARRVRRSAAAKSAGSPGACHVVKFSERGPGALRGGSRPRPGGREASSQRSCRRAQLFRTAAVSARVRNGALQRTTSRKAWQSLLLRCNASKTAELRMATHQRCSFPPAHRDIRPGRCCYGRYRPCRYCLHILERCIVRSNS